MWLVDIILHAPAYLESFAISHGAWVYALLFSIIFAEVRRMLLQWAFRRLLLTKSFECETDGLCVLAVLAG
jgi:hypothetical protein